MLAVVCPGQGSQNPGFLTPWLAEVPGVAERLDWLATVAGLDLAAHGTVSDEETIRDTAIAQPLVVAAGLAVLPALLPDPSDVHQTIGVTAGHSVGELTAAAVAGVLSVEQAMVLVRERGSAMASAAALVETGMSAVLGGDPEELAAAADQLGLVLANHNGAGQTVVAGSLEALAKLAENPPPKARVRALQVAGAFHTPYMEGAVARMRTHAAALSPADARTRLLSNADGAVVHDGRAVLDRLVGQISRPVRWDLCSTALADLGVTGLLELPPAGVLSRLAKRELKGVDVVSLATPEDLPAAQALIAEHGGKTLTSNLPSWRLVVSPGKGLVRRAVGDVGTDVAGGSVVATVDGSREQVDVVAVHGGTVVEWLVEEGDPVRPGQPLLRLHPVSDLVAAL